MKVSNSDIRYFHLYVRDPPPACVRANFRVPVYRCFHFNSVSTFHFTLSLAFIVISIRYRKVSNPLLINTNCASASSHHAYHSGNTNHTLHTPDSYQLAQAAFLAP